MWDSLLLMHGFVRGRADRDDVGFVAIRAGAVNLLAVKRTIGDSIAPLPRNDDGYLFLERDRFYILVTRERLIVPADYALQWCLMTQPPENSGALCRFLRPGWGVGSMVGGLS